MCRIKLWLRKRFETLVINNKNAWTVEKIKLSIVFGLTHFIVVQLVGENDNVFIRFDVLSASVSFGRWKGADSHYSNTLTKWSSQST